MPTNTNKLVQFVLLSRAQYDALETKESRILYFIRDTHEIYRGEVNYSSAVVFHDAGQRPEIGAIGKLYINNSNKEGTTFDGQNWSVVIPAISSTVLDNNNQPVTNPVSGVAVKNYVASVAQNTLSQCVTNITWDATNKAVVYTVNGSNTSVPLTKLATQLAYDSTTGVISLKDLENTTISSVNIPLDNFITGGAYNATTKTLDLTMQNGSTISIPAADLVQLYNAQDSNSVDITISTDANGNNTISASVKVSADAGNAVEVRADGLYVAPTTSKMNKVGAGHDDEVIIAGVDGDATASGYKIGGATLNANAATQQTLLATEAAVTAVKNSIEANAETLYVPIANVITRAADIDVDNPDPEMVISEYALVEAMSWNEIPDPAPSTPTYVQASGKYVAGTTYYTDSTGSTTVDTSTFSEPTDVSSYFVAQETPTYEAASGTFVAGTTYYTDNTGSATVDTTGFEEGVTDVSSYFVAGTPTTTYVAATGTFVSGTTYYTDNTGNTTVDTSSFSEGTDVSSYYVEA